MEPGPARREARFPMLRVTASGVGFLIAACVWLGWGYCWDVTPKDIVRGKPPLWFSTWEGRCVRVQGTTFDMARLGLSYIEPAFPTHFYDIEDPKSKVALAGEPHKLKRDAGSFAGRLVRAPAWDCRSGSTLYFPDWWPVVDSQDYTFVVDDQIDTVEIAVVNWRAWHGWRQSPWARLRNRLRRLWPSGHKEIFTYPEAIGPESDLERWAYEQYAAMYRGDGAPRPTRFPERGTPAEALTLDTSRGRIDGMGLIAAVVAFWSGVFLYLWLTDWRRARERFALAAGARGASYSLMSDTRR